MDSDDDMHDAYDGESFEDDCYSEDDAAFGSNDDDDVVDDYILGDEGSDDLPSRREVHYSVLSEADVRKLQEEDVTRLSNVLSISKDHSWILLCHYNWNVSKLHDEWFADERNVRKAVGLLEHQAIVLTGSELTCKICFETYPRCAVSGAACGHQFCHGCWRGYIGTAINDGPGCLMLRCPDPSCSAAVGQCMVNTFASETDREKYSQYLLRSYIENNRKTKWCPAPGCNFCVNFDMSTSNYDVCCGCTYSFCWNCREEAHRPVDCETVTRWILKNSAESENMNWILANSKACPKCKRPIEKNLGCMHMTCTPPCRFEFCWMCLAAWSDHGERTGGFYACNRYEAAKRDGIYDEAERRREMAKNSIERYTHYYERWATNQSSREKALADLSSLQTEKLGKLSDKLSTSETQLHFIIEAWEQIVECRRVLRWTYAYGYYLPEHETAKIHMFEYLQGEAESGLERLHACAEKELQGYFDAENPSAEEFIAFRCKVAGLTSVTRNYFENLVRALENGLKEVSSSHNNEPSEPDKPSKSKTKNHGGKRKGAGSSSSANSGTVTLADYEDWRCSHCTYANPKTTDICEVCEHQINE